MPSPAIKEAIFTSRFCRTKSTPMIATKIFSVVRTSGTS